MFIEELLLLLSLALRGRLALSPVRVAADDEAAFAVTVTVDVLVAQGGVVVPPERIGVVVDLAVAVLVHAVTGLGDAGVDVGVVVVAVLPDIGDVARGGVAGVDAQVFVAEVVAVFIGVPGGHVDGVVIDHVVTVVVDVVAELVGAGVDLVIVIVAVAVELACPLRAGEGRLLAALLEAFRILDLHELHAAVFRRRKRDVARSRGRDRHACAVAVAVEVVVPDPVLGVVLRAAAVVVDAVADLDGVRVHARVLVVAVLVRRVAVAVRVRSEHHELFVAPVITSDGADQHDPEPDPSKKSVEVDHLFLRPCFDILPRWKWQNSWRRLRALFCPERLNIKEPRVRKEGNV